MSPLERQERLLGFLRRYHRPMGVLNIWSGLLGSAYSVSEGPVLQADLQSLRDRGVVRFAGGRWEATR